MADLSKLERDLAALERDSTLYDSDNLAARFEALKTLDFLGEAFQIQAGHPFAASGLRRVRALQGDLGARNQALFRRLRSGIRTGTVTPGQLRTLLESNCRYRRGDTACMHWGAEAADALAAGIFRSDCPSQPWDGSDVEMIHYESTPVSAVLELVDRVPLTRGNRFVDIGSGLGQVVLLVHLLTGVEAVGLEVVPAYVEQARGEAARLGVDGVSFREGDARSADLCGGTVYFLFSPFRGQMLQTVLNRLGHEARTRRLTVCSFGPCTEQIAGEPWLTLQEAGMNHEFRLAVFHSNS
ncbi:MAG: methyltransferase domain-containing protein [Caldilineaceae bacterium]|nr:methyltransferase domain-containing protein [Caldilineaceae bacterium]